MNSKIIYLTDRWKIFDSGQKVAATNGVFDCLHFGHVKFLKTARKYSDYLIVGMNSDASVRELKGPDRPIIPELQRAEMLAALGCVDLVCIFHEKTAVNFLKLTRPNVYFKTAGNDLDAGEVAVLRDMGSDILLAPMVEGISTTNIIKKIEDNYQKRISKGSIFTDLTR